MISFYVWLYAAVGFGIFLGVGLPDAKEFKKRFVVGNKEVIVYALKYFGLCMLLWPFVILAKVLG